MSDGRLGQEGDVRAVQSGFASGGFNPMALFEKLVLGIEGALGGQPVQRGEPLPRGRGGAPALADIASEARRLFDTEGEVSSMQYLGQYQGALSEDQMRQVLAAVSEAAVRGPQGAEGGTTALPAQVQTLADRVGIRQNPNYPENRINDLITHLPTGQRDREKALTMLRSGGVTQELMAFLESKWGNR